MATEVITTWVRHVVRRRSGGICERCGLEPATNYHHRRARGMGGTRKNIHTAEWLLHLCGSGTTGCHGYIEAHPEISYSKGWKLRRNAYPFNSPVQTPAGWVILTAEGEYQPWTWADG